MQATSETAKRRIVVVGGGFGGAFAAKRLVKKAGPDVEVVLIDRNNYLTFYPLLIEAGVGAIEPRHVVVPLRRFVKGAKFILADVRSVDPQAKTLTYEVLGALGPQTMTYDTLVMAPGSVTRMPNVPGLHEYGYQVKTVGDVIEHRDRGIRLLELASNVQDPVERKRLLTVVVVGGNYTGVEMAGEYHAFLSLAMKGYPDLDPKDLNVMLVERSEDLLSAVKPELAKWCKETLIKRGIDVRTKESVTAIDDYAVTLASRPRIPAETVIWAAGIGPAPVLASSGLPLNKAGYLECDVDCRVSGVPDVWAVGDSATIMGVDGKPYAPTAQSASRMGPHCADNILRAMRGEPTKPFRYHALGSFAAIGKRQAVAEIKGVPLKGFLGWFMFRGAYLSKMPTFSMKARLALDWAAELLLPFEPVQLGVYSGRGGRVTKALAGDPNAPEKPQDVAEAITR